MKNCLLPLALLSLLAVLCAGQLEDTDFCTYYDLRRPAIHMSCPKVPYQAAVGEAEEIITYGSAKFNNFLSRIQSSSSLKISQSGTTSVIISQVLHGPLASLASSLQRYRRGATLQVLRAWTDQQSSDVSLPLFYEGRAAMLSATGVSTAELFSLAVYADFGWVWYASADHIIVAVRGSCSLVADIGVWIDSSGSISGTDFFNAQSVVRGIVDRFGVSENGVHFSLGSFSNQVWYSRLDDSYDASTVLDTLRNLPRFRHATYTDLALETWGSEVFTEAGGARSGVAKIGIIFTDGEATRAFEHHLPTLDNLGVTIFAIPINSRWYRPGLEKLATAPPSLHVLTSRGVHSADYLVDTLLSGRFCRASTLLNGNRGVSGEGREGDVRYYSMPCPYIGQGVTVELETLEGDATVYASASVRSPGPFAAATAVVSSTSVGYQRIRRLTVPVNRGSENMYVAVGCRAAVNRFRVVAWENLFDGVERNVTVDGGAPGNTLVTTLRSPYISDYSSYKFSITAGNSEGQFFINSLTGQLTTTRAFNIDQTHFTLVVTMTSQVLTCRQSQITLQVTVLHTSNRFAPTLSNPHQMFEVSEHAHVGQLVHNFQYYDPDRDSFSITLVGNVEGAFIISATGELTVAKQLNATVLNQYHLEIQAEDHGRPVLTSRYAFTVTVIDQDDPPHFIESCALRNLCICEIVEQTAANSYICQGLVLGFDFDIRSEYRQIFHKIDVDTLPISVDASGQLFLTSTVDRDLLSSDEFKGEVTISNSRQFVNSASTRVIFRILDLNDNHPQFERAVYQFSLSEDADVRTVLGMVKAVDPDAAENGTITYSIRSTEDVPFIVTSSEDVVLSGTVNRETVPSYRFTILAVDLGAERLSGSTEVSITLDDVNDNSPVFSAKSLTYVATIPESASRGTRINTIPTLAVSDADIGRNGHIFFSFAGGSSDPFSIDESTGYISVSGLLDAEYQHNYFLRIIARDQGIPSRSSYASLSIAVSDVNDEDPVFARPFYSFYISEGAFPGKVLGNLEALDPDLTQTQITFALPDQTKLPFALDPRSGELTLSAQLDYENTSLYQFAALAKDSGRPSSRTASVRVTVEVQDIPDTVPMVDSGILQVSVPENIGIGHAIVEITSSDRDAAYRIDAGNTNATFMINGTSGSLLTARELDYEEVSQYTLSVTVYHRHNASLSTSVSVVVNVTDINDNSPVLVGVPRQLNLSENVPPFSILFTAEATDADSALWTNFYFSLLETTSGACAQDLFMVFQNGSVAVRGAGVSLGRDCIYRLTVAVLDNGRNSQSRLSTAQCDVYVYDVNDNPPIFQANGSLTVNVTESTRSPFEVVTVIADDADSGANSDVEYRIGGCQAVSGCQVEDYDTILHRCHRTQLSSCPFSVDLNTGTVLFLGEIDHESVSLFRVLVVASDNGSPSQSTTLTLFVNVQDTNDSPPQMSPKNVDLDLPEGTPRGSTIAEFDVSDSDNFGDISHLNYSLTSQPSNLSFTLRRASDGVILILQDSLDFEQLQEVFVTISVSDGVFTDEARIHLLITNTNDNDPVFLHPLYNFSVSESAALGELVGMVEATDIDGPDFGLLAYSLIGSSIPFNVSRSSGEIRVSSSLDYETTPQYDFHVLVFDSNDKRGARNATVAVTVYVQNEDDNPPTVIAPPSIIVRDPSTTSVITFTATDNDLPGEAPPVKFALDQVTVTSRSNTTSVFTLKISYADNIHPRTVFRLSVVLEYVCEVVQFSLDASSAELRVFTLCSVTLSVPSTLTLGSNATLMCEASANTPTVYYWYKDGTRISRPASSGALSLNNVGYEQSGSYSCAAENEAGRLTTGVVQEIVIHGPPVVLPPDSQTAATGVEVSFTCLIHSNLNYTVEWTLNGVPLALNPNIESVGDTLTIHSVLGNHEGSYRCVVTNAVGTTTTQPANLTVCDCKEPFMGNFTFEVPRSIGSGDASVGSVASPYQMYFNYHYDIVAGNEDKVFAIGKTDGAITIVHSIASTQRLQYTLTVYAEDGTRTYTGNTFVLVKVIDINSYSPVFGAPNSVEVLETQLLSSPILQFFVRDPDHGSSGQVSVFINETQDGSTFRLDHDANDAYSLYTSVAFNASKQDYYSLVLVARDHGPSPRLTQLRLAIKVKDVNEPPVFILPCATLGHCYASFTEDSPAGHVVTAVSAYDTDTGVLSDLKYAFTTIVPFAIDGNGTVTLSRTIDFDTVSMPVFVLEVIVTDGGGLSLKTTLSLSVTDVNDIAPQFSSPSFSIVVKESTALNASLRSFVAQDREEEEKGQVSYSLENTTLFEINPSTGELTLAGALDYESQLVHKFVIVASDHGVPPLSSSASVTVTVENVNDIAPRFVNLPSECIEVEESRSFGATVIPLSVEDADSVRFTYGIVSGQDRDNPTFLIEENTGVLSVYSELDAETQDRYQLELSVYDVVSSDSGSFALSATATLCVRVTDVNEYSPNFSEDHYNFSLPDGAQPGHFIGSVLALDRDHSIEIGAASLSYAIRSGNELGIFLMNSSSGALTLASTVNGSSSFQLTVVVADDGGRVDLVDVVVWVVDSSMEALLFSTGNLTVHLPDNNADGVTIARLDEEFVLSYFGTTAVNVTVTVSPSTVTVIFVDSDRTIVITSTVDREVIGDTIHIVATTFVEGSGITPLICTFTALIRDVNDNPPEFLPSGPFHEYVNEDAAPGFEVIVIQARDDDSGVNSEIEYSMTATSIICRNLFALNSTTGAVQVIGGLRLQSITECHFVISASDNGSPRLTVSTQLLVTIQDVNDNAPIFSRPSYKFDISESDRGAYIVFAYVAATDEDHGVNSEIRYSIKPASVSGSKGGVQVSTDISFMIDATRGALSATLPFDYEREDVLLFTVVATDGGSPAQSSEVNVTIHVTDYNDNAPQLEMNHYDASVNESIPPSTTLFTVVATDRDGPANQPLVYRLTVQPRNSPIAIDTQTGLIYTLASLDYELLPIITGTILVFDGRSAATAALTLRIENENDNSPVFPTDCSSVVREDAELGVTLFTCAATDLDFGTFGQLRFAIVSGNSDGIFSFTPFTGEMYLNKPLDYEKKAYYALTLSATDGGGVVTTVNATVTVQNVDDNPPMLIGPREFQIINTPHNHPILVTNLTAEDEDVQGQAPVVTFSLGSNTTSDIFRQRFVVELVVADSSGMSSRPVVQAIFQQACYFAEFRLKQVDLQHYLELWTLCTLSVALTGEPALGGDITLSATAVGAIPVQKYCWYRNSVLMVCTTSSHLDLMMLTLADEGSYHAVAHTALGVIQSEPVGLTIEVPPSITCSPAKAVQEEDSVTLLCWIYNPKRVPLEASWTFKGQVLPFPEGTGSVQEGSVYYFIDSATPGDQGTYTCAIVSTLGAQPRSAASVFLSVYSGPSLISLDVEVFNFSYEHQCQLFDIYTFLNDVARAYMEGTSPNVLSYTSDNLCEPGPCFPNPCQNGGICHDMGNSSVCECLPGWGGRRCATHLDHCATSPCLFGGTCVPSGLQNESFVCLCPSGRAGKSCELIEYICSSEQCLSNTVCLPSEHSTLGFVCIPDATFRLTLNTPYFVSSRGHTPEGGLFVSNSSRSLSDYHLSIFDTEIVIRSLISSEMNTLSNQSRRILQLCVPRIVAAGGGSVDMVLNCPLQANVSIELHLDVCRVLQQSGLFTSCTTPSGAEVLNTTSNGRVQCEFYMHDREGMSIPAEKILEVIRTQTIVYFNSTEYRVLQVERANNQTSIIDPVPSSGGAGGFPIWAGVLLGLLLCLAIGAACVSVACCIFCAKRRRKIVEKEFIVQRSDAVPPKESSIAWNPYTSDEPGAEVDWAFETPPLSLVGLQGAGEFVDDEEFYDNPSAWSVFETENRNLSESANTQDFVKLGSSSSQAPLLQSFSAMNNTERYIDVFKDAARQQVTVRNPLQNAASVQAPPVDLSEEQLQRESKYHSMHEDNPLYAAVAEIFKEETVISVEREVVIEAAGQDGEDSSLPSVSQSVQMTYSDVTESSVQVNATAFGDGHL